MKLGTANIQNFPDMPARQVALDASVIAASCTLAGLQEIQPREDTPVVERALDDGWWMVGRHREVPVIGREDRWQLLDHWVVPFDRPELPRPQNRHAGVVSVVVRSATKRHLPPFALVNTHLVAGGYNGDKDPRIQQRWDVEWGLYRDEALRLYRMGLSVFTVGDLNHPRPPQVGRVVPFQWLSPSGTPDHLGMVVNDASVTLGAGWSHERIPLHSDHALHRITGPLRLAD